MAVVPFYKLAYYILPQTADSSMSTGTPIEAGIYVAVYLEKYKDEEPQIGQMATVSPDMQ